MSPEKRVEEFLKKKGITPEVLHFKGSTRNSILAAEALGCTVSEIAKSIVFKGRGVVVVVIAGDKRVDLAKLTAHVKSEVRVATAAEVREVTDYPAGGVPPFPHYDEVRVLLDSSLGRHDFVWAAAGLPNSVMKLTLRDVSAVLGGGFVDLAEK